MISQNAEKNLFSSVSNKWRSSVEKCINSLKKSANNKKREECVEEILQILCRAIRQDRDEIWQRSKKRRESLEWWSSFGKNNVSYLFLLIAGGFILFKSCLVANSWFNQLKTMPMPTMVLIIVCFFIIYLVVYLAYTLIGAKEKIESFFKWISKYFGEISKYFGQ